MGIKFKVGAQVHQVVPVISGEVVGVAIVDGEVSFEVSYIGADGEPHSRFFREDEIEAVDAIEIKAVTE